MQLFVERWGPVSPLQESARKLAGSWKNNFAAKYTAEMSALPWQKPSRFEVEASVLSFVAPLPSAAPTSTTVLFLVDGSGSVTEGAPACMTPCLKQMCALRH